MSCKSAIIFDSVWKRFRLTETSYRSLRDDIVHIWRRRRAGVAGADQSPDYFWALKDVSFEVQPGDALGIIGPNGAGKSTTLKLLTRISRPTRGRITTRGKISALIEVGAGMHPELTGRENIFLYGSIMGLSRRELMRRMDDIVDFSGLSKFVDVPVKRYSSGMYMRLAFSVIAHMRADIILIDEVLAVGDLSFQSRCIERLREMVVHGTAVIFVSHNLHLVSGFCHRAILLDLGVNCCEGQPLQVIDQYVGRQAKDRPTQCLMSGEMQILSIEVFDLHGLPCYDFDTSDSIFAKIKYRTGPSVLAFGCHLVVRRSDGVASGGSTTIVEPTSHEDGQPGSGVITCTIHNARLIRGWYRLDVYFSDPSHVVDYATLGSASFRVRGDSSLDDRFGSYALEADWDVSDHSSRISSLTHDRFVPVEPIDLNGH